MIFIDVEEEDKTEPWFHDSSSLKVSNREKKYIVMVALPVAIELCDSIWVKRESQRTESTVDTNTMKGTLQLPPGMLPDC